MSVPTRPPLVAISNLSRSFQGRRVLSVGTFTLLPGELVAVVGTSGCGKTTLLETIGSMSRCSAEELQQSTVTYQLHLGGHARSLTLAQLWADRSLRTQVRVEALSFMFQQPNLLPFLSPIENALLGGLLQGDTEANARARACHQLTQLGLDDTAQRGRVSQLSGGMLQRLALARACLPAFQLLLADEPTGSLDPLNAAKVWQLLQTLSQENPASALLVVTHDLPLAIQYASRVVVIAPDGTLQPQDVPLTDALRKDPTVRATLEALMKGETPAPQTAAPAPMSDRPPQLIEAGASPSAASDADETKALPIAPVALGQTQLRAFFRHVALLNLPPKQTLLLLSILGVALLALGVVQGGQQLLAARMSDPYVSWLKVDPPYSDREKIGEIRALLQKEGPELGLQSTHDFWSAGINLQDIGRRGLRTARGTTLGAQEAVMERVCGLVTTGPACEPPPPETRGPLPIPSLLRGEQDCGLIVTRSLLRNFGYPEDAAFVLTTREQSPQHLVPWPVRAVVEALPDGRDLALTPYARRQYFFGELAERAGTELILYIPQHGMPEAAQVEQQLSALLASAPLSHTLGAFVRLTEPYLETHQPGWRIAIGWKDTIPELEQRDTLYQQLEASGRLPKGALRLYAWSKLDGAGLERDDAGALSVYFAPGSLDRAPELRRRLLDAFGIELDIAKVEALKNYHTVVAMSLLLTWALLGLSGISTFVFISFAVGARLLELRAFLGTLLAFGASAGTLTHIVRRELLLRLIWALFFSVGGGALVGVLATSPLMALAGLSLAENESAFDLLNGWTLLYCGIVCGSGLLAVSSTARTLLHRDPAALLYDRLEST